MIYAVQLFVALFSILAGRHDGVPVTKFQDNGATPAETSRFHSTGLKMRACQAISGVVCVFIHYYTPQLWPAVIMATAAGIFCWLISWSVFDPSVNLSRVPKKKWYYLGEHAGTDRWLFERFGDRAAKVKTIFCFVTVAVGNVLIAVLT